MHPRAILMLHIATGDTRSLARQIVDGVRRQIAAGELAVGAALPSVRGLALQLSINPNTVVRAYRELEIREVLTTQQGTGTFITDKKPRANEVERQRRVAQLAGDLLARAGADGITLQELLDYFTELQNDSKRRT